jgi:hypothetical protein
MRVSLSIAAVVVATVCVASATAAPTALAVSPTTVRAGHLVTVKGNADGCAVGNTVFILSRAFKHTHEFAGVPALLARVRTGGRFGIRTTIPRARHAGRYVLTARCGGGNLGVSARLHVIR